MSRPIYRIPPVYPLPLPIPKQTPNYEHSPVPARLVLDDVAELSVASSELIFNAAFDVVQAKTPKEMVDDTITGLNINVLVGDADAVRDDIANKIQDEATIVEDAEPKPNIESY